MRFRIFFPIFNSLFLGNGAQKIAPDVVARAVVEGMKLGGKIIDLLPGNVRHLRIARDAVGAVAGLTGRDVDLLKP